MKDYLKFIKESEKFLNTAEGLLRMYYSIKETKILLAVLDNLFLSLTKALSSFCYYNLYYKKIEPFKDDFITKYNILIKLAKSYGLSNYEFLIEVKELIVYHKKSNIEFERNNTIYMCIDDYNDCKKLNLKILRDFISKAKLFISKINSIIK